MTTLTKLDWLGHLTSRMSNRHSYEASCILAKDAVAHAGAFVAQLDSVAQVRKASADPTGNSTNSRFMGLNSPDPGGFMGPIFLDTEMVLQLARDAAREIRRLEAKLASREQLCAALLESQGRAGEVARDPERVQSFLVSASEGSLTPEQLQALAQGEALLLDAPTVARLLA